MKKLLLISLLLTGCATTKVIEPKEYNCISFNEHGARATHQDINNMFIPKGYEAICCFDHGHTNLECKSIEGLKN